LAEAALLFCRANLRQRLRLEEVAAAVGYSPRHLSRSFARHIGRPFSEQLRLLRMHVAAELLTGSDLSIAEIGEHVGYPTPAHFTRTFRRATGLSPRAYRRAPVPMSIA
jgi:two-component system response regulator YesN